MYVGDTLRIRRVDLASNRISTIAGTGESGGGTILNADARQSAITVSGIAVDSAGNVFFGDVNGCGVMRIDAATNNLTRVAGQGPDPRPSSVATPGTVGWRSTPTWQGRGDSRSTRRATSISRSRSAARRWQGRAKRSGGSPPAPITSSPAATRTS